MADRERHLDQPHVRPLMNLIKQMRIRGLDVPSVDPEDGGVNARALFLLETPGPAAVRTGFVSQENPDPSAQNMKCALQLTGFERSEVLLWNVVPQCISTIERNRNATVAEIREGAADAQAFLECLHDLKVVVFCGRSAEKAMRYLNFSEDLCVLSTFHPAGRSYSHPILRKHIHSTFRAAHSLISG